jgi:hypothetical protein
MRVLPLAARERARTALAALKPTAVLARATRDAPDLDDAHFAADTCRNCGAALAAAHCGECGQKRAQRFRFGALRSEAWENNRLFEFELVRAALRLAVQPGAVARDYVLGARKRHVHPLKLLLVAVGLLLWILSATQYLGAGTDQASRAFELVQKYGKWSFSLGIVAILATSLLVFGKRLKYTFAEHLVLATYAHFVVLAASVLNLLPLLAIPGAEAVRAHRAAANLYMPVVEAAIVGLAFAQFFCLDLRRQWPRWLLAVLAFVALKKGLQLLYARAVVKAVLAGLA